MRTPLSIPDDSWRSRWLVLTSWGRLHRVSEITWDDADMIRGRGVTLCGRHGYLYMPGVVSRLGLRRCAHCCRILGVPRGDGALYNDGIVEPAP